MTFKKTLPLLLAATLATAPAFAEDGFNLIGGSDAQVEKVAKAPREANGHSNGINLKEGAIAFGLGALGPLGAIGLPFVTISEANRTAVEMNSFYSGTVVRGKVKKVMDLPRFTGKIYGVDRSTLPGDETVKTQMVALVLDVDGPTGSDRYIYARTDAGYEVGDIVDGKTMNGVFPGVNLVNDKLATDFNKGIPRVVGLYCKHDNPACLDNYDSSLGVLSRHTDTEFPPSQYLIDPKIIQADQERMRRESEEKTKTASNWGESSLF